MYSIQNEESSKQKAIFITQVKGKCRKFGKVGHKPDQCKSKQIKEDDAIHNYCKKLGHLKADCFKLLKRNKNQGEELWWCSKWDSKYDNGCCSFVKTIREFGHEICIGDSVASCYYYNNDRGI